MSHRLNYNRCRNNRIRHKLWSIKKIFNTFTSLMRFCWCFLVKFYHRNYWDSMWIKFMVPHFCFKDINKGLYTFFLELFLQKSVMICLCSFKQQLFEIIVSFFKLCQWKKLIFTFREIYYQCCLIIFPSISICIGVNKENLFEYSTVKLSSISFFYWFLDFIESTRALFSALL